MDEIKMSKKSAEFFNIFKDVRHKIADCHGYYLEYAIRIAFDRYEREKKETEQQSNCNLPHVSNSVCCKKGCNEPVYEFGYCIKHYCISENT